MRNNAEVVSCAWLQTWNDGFSLFVRCTYDSFSVFKKMYIEIDSKFNPINLLNYIFKIATEFRFKIFKSPALKVKTINRDKFHMRI